MSIAQLNKIPRYFALYLAIRFQRASSQLDLNAGEVNVSLVIMISFMVLLSAVRASVWVYGPDELREELTRYHHRKYIPSSLGNFGNPPYGREIIGNLYWPGDNAEFACRPLKYIDYGKDHEHASSAILLVKQGGCSVVQKVRHAQDIGAAAVLIYNYNNESLDDIVMHDDGTAGNISISAFLISNSDGLSMLRYLNSEDPHKKVVIKLTFEINSSSKTVDYQIWMSPEHSLIRAFLQSFAASAKQLKDITVFTPHYVLSICYECRITDYTTDNPNCFGGGRYCAPDPDGSGVMTGRDVLYEDLRQICIYQQYKGGHMEKWWDYTSSLSTACNNHQITADCSHKAMALAKVDPNPIDKCVSTSFDNSDHAISKNSLFAAERVKQNQIGAFFFPSIIINNQTFRGDFEPDEVKQAICAGFKELPGICKHTSSSSTSAYEPMSQIGLKTVIGVAIFIVSALTVFMAWMSRRMRKDMQSEMRREVSQYIALAEISKLDNSVEVPQTALE